MVYAKFRGFTGPARDLWDAIKRVNMFGHWMDFYTVGDPLEFPPLQAADIWAYSIGNLGEQRESAKPEAARALQVFVSLAMKARHGLLVHTSRPTGNIAAHRARSRRNAKG